MFSDFEPNNQVSSLSFSWFDPTRNEILDKTKSADERNTEIGVFLCLSQRGSGVSGRRRTVEKKEKKQKKKKREKERKTEMFVGGDRIDWHVEINECANRNKEIRAENESKKLEKKEHNVQF